MKKIVITLFALMLLASMANANVIGIFGDMGAATCSGPFIGMPTIYLFAELSDVAAITTVEFGVAGLPMNPTEAMQTVGSRSLPSASSPRSSVSYLQG